MPVAVTNHNWKFYQDDFAEPVATLAGENVKATLLNNTNVIRLRIMTEVSGGSVHIAVSSMYWSLDNVNWNSFGPASAWDFANGKATEFDNVTLLKLSDSTVNGPYIESTGTSPGLYTNQVEVDIAIRPVLVLLNTTYYIKWIGSFIGHTNPQVLTASALSKTRVPTSDFSVQWTPSVGTDNYATIDEYPATNDGDYNTQVSPNVWEDIFGFIAFDVPVGSIINNVAVYIRGYKISSGMCAGGLYVGTWYPATLISLHDGVPFEEMAFTWSTNPATSLAWTVSDVNGTGANPLNYFGYKGSGTFNRISRLYIIVNYTAPESPINTEIMRGLKWFHDGINKGCYLYSR